MRRPHGIILATLLAASAMLGIFAVTASGPGNAPAAATTAAPAATAMTDQQYAARVAALDRADAKLRASLRARPPKLPARVARVHHAAPAPYHPAAPAPQPVAYTPHAAPPAHHGDDEHAASGGGDQHYEETEGEDGEDD